MSEQFFSIREQITTEENEAIANDKLAIREAIYTVYEMVEETWGEYGDEMFEELVRYGHHVEYTANINKLIMYSDDFTAEKDIEMYKDNSRYRVSPELAQAATFHKITQLQCGKFTNTALAYLEVAYSGEFDTYRLKLHEGAKHFDWKDHVVALIHSKASGKWYAFSPANIFNSLFESVIENEEIVPHFRGRPIQRATDILMTDTETEAINCIDEIEGIDSVENWSLKSFETNPEDLAKHQTAGKHLNILEHALKMKQEFGR